MSPVQYERLQGLFLEARGLPTRSRELFLASVEQSDPGLRDPLHALLSEDEGSSGLVNAFVQGGGARLLAGVLDDVQPRLPDGSVSADLARPMPRQIGRYTIVRQIGEGGMGVVYEAQQPDPKRRVALKVIRESLASPRFLARFHREAQMLGRLQHRGIARIYDAHTAPAPGEPAYFVMELVDGPPLLRFANENRLDARQRLELIAEVCDALDHAHGSGLVHRDLKPGNILVEPPATSAGNADDAPGIRSGGQPKILDFGVARSDDLQTLTDIDTGRMIGTVPYMSPEQASGGAIDRRSDIYSVGVIAFELLAGRLPYDLGGRMVHEAARIIRDEEPARLGSIDRQLRGDVEVIVARALEKDPQRRYGSAAELAADIRRYLNDRPIIARAPSITYRLRKLLKRRRPLAVGLGIAAAGAAMLIIGAIALARAGLLRRALPGAGEVRAGDAPPQPSPVTEIRFADAWLAANPGAEAYAFDQFYPGFQPLGGPLGEGTDPVTLRLAGGVVTLSAFDIDGKPVFPIADRTRHAKTSDAELYGVSGSLVMEFNPPIRAFYSMFGSLAERATVTARLFQHGTLVGTTVSAPSTHLKNTVVGHGFISSTPIDRIEFTTNELDQVMLGAYCWMVEGVPNLGKVTISGYDGPYGDDVYLDFACVFDAGDGSAPDRPPNAPSDDERRR